MATQGMVSYFQIKWNREYSHTFHMLLNRCYMQNYTIPQDKRCKQMYGWHINNACTFLIKIDTEFISFGFTKHKI